MFTRNEIQPVIHTDKNGLHGNKWRCSYLNNFCPFIRLNRVQIHSHKNLFSNTKQECIPVGCVPPASVAISGGGSAHRGVFAPGGVVYLGVSAGGSVCPGGVCPGGVCPEGVVCVSVYGSVHPLWTEWLTDRCKNITFANFVCGQ